MNRVTYTHNHNPFRRSPELIMRQNAFYLPAERIGGRPMTWIIFRTAARWTTRRLGQGLHVVQCARQWWSLNQL